ncbi:MAG: DUF4329 domain-containing protein [Pseudomonadota bacterium]
MLRVPSLLAALALSVSACAPAPTGQIFVQPAPNDALLQPMGQPSGAVAQPTPTAVQSNVRIPPNAARGGISVAPPNAPSGPVPDQFAINFLNSIQARSIAEEREYCGYFFLNAQGQIEATRPVPGTFASCAMPAPRPGEGIFASYHTHGAYGSDYDNEVPSTLDLQSDFQFGIDGYVSTPGGRVWLVDFQTRSTRQLCGLRCVTSDPGFVPQGEAGIRASFTLGDLQRRMASF